MWDAVFVGWFYQQGGAKIGPLSTRDLVELIRTGKLSNDVPIWKAWRKGDQELFFPSHAGVPLGNWKGNPRTDW